VRQPGRFDYFDGMTVQDLLRLGGGPKLEADRASAMLTRVNLDGNEAGFEHIAVVLPGRAGAGVNNAAMRLQPRDILVVQPLAQYQDVGYVELEGEVAKPGRYAIVPGERLSRLIARR
jgi:protein involved in polysaccharide export with SLBB domain